MDKLNGCIFGLNIMAYQKNIVLFGSESVYNLKILKTNIKSHGDEVREFYDKGGFKSYLFSSNQLRFSSQER